MASSQEPLSEPGEVQELPKVTQLVSGGGVGYMENCGKSFGKKR